ncbi:LPS assembly lipoprotein LptE [Brucella melitensis]|uniref:LPS assembly lipoprotein LptE n=1 Tax=Brucella melitensis TaxID=29459 RepID=UPI00321865A7
MSLPDRFLSAIKAFCIGFFALGAAVLIAGCSVQPLYSSNHGAGSAIGGSVTPDMRTKLASIAIDPAGDIFGQDVRNELIFLFSGGAGEPANPAYRLSLGLSTNTIAAVSVDIGDQTDRTGRPSAGIVKATSNFVLRDKDGKPLATGSRMVAASFDRPRQEFANLRAERDARERAAKELAQQVYLAVALKMSKL